MSAQTSCASHTQPAFLGSLNLQMNRTLSQYGYGGARYIIYKYVVSLGRVANVEWLTVELTPDLETNWPVVFQLQV